MQPHIRWWMMKPANPADPVNCMNTKTKVPQQNKGKDPFAVLWYALRCQECLQSLSNLHKMKRIKLQTNLYAYHRGGNTQKQGKENL